MQDAESHRANRAWQYNCTCLIPAQCPSASKMLCNEHHTAPMHSCKCHVLFMTLVHNKVNPTTANEPSKNIALYTARQDHGSK